jgi:integrase
LDRAGVPPEDRRDLTTGQITLELLECHQARFFSPGAIGLSVSRWRAWQEMADAVLTALRGPLSLPELIRRGPRLRGRLTLAVVLSPEEVLQFLACVPGLKHRTILTVCYAAGLRISEALRLK